MAYYCLNDDMKRCFLFIIILCAPFLFKDISHAELYGRASVSRQESNNITDGASNKSYTVSESYTLGFSKELTSVIRLNGDARISINNVDGKKTERIYPQLTLSFTPPQLYDLSFSFNRTDSAPSYGDRTTTSNMNTSFSLPSVDWPSLAISFNRSTISDFLDPHKRDSVNDFLNLNSSYNFNVSESDVRVDYSFTSSMQEDKVNISKSETLTHIANAKMSRKFMEKKMNVTLNAGLRRTDEKIESLLPTRYEKILAVSQGLFSVDDTPGTDPLVDKQELVDGDKNAGINGIDLNGAYRNIGFRLSSSQEIKTIRLYLEPGDYPDISVNVSSDKYGFEVYSSDDGITWTLITLTTETYNSTSYSIELALPEGVAAVNSQYFKVVNMTNPASAVAINVTEIEVVSYLLKDAITGISAETSTKSAGFTVVYNPIPRLAMNYRLSYEQSEGGYYDTDINIVNNGLNASYILIPKYLSLSVAYSSSTTDTRQKAEISEILSSDSGTNSYSMSLSSTPLPTLSATLGFSLSDSSLDGVVQSKNNGLSTNIRMALYEGVTVSLANSISNTNTPSTAVNTKSINNTATINLVPLERFTVSVNTSYITTETESLVQTTSSNRKTLSSWANYTMTRRLYFTYSNVLEPSSSHTFSVSWLPTKAIQGDVRYGLSGTSDTFSTNLRWHPLARLDLSVSYNVTNFDNAANDKSESIFARVSLSF